MAITSAYLVFVYEKNCFKRRAASVPLTALEPNNTHDFCFDRNLLRHTAGHKCESFTRPSPWNADNRFLSFIGEAVPVGIL